MVLKPCKQYLSLGSAREGYKSGGASLPRTFCTSFHAGKRYHDKPPWSECHNYVDNIIVVLWAEALEEEINTKTWSNFGFLVFPHNFLAVRSPITINLLGYLKHS